MAPPSRRRALRLLGGAPAWPWLARRERQGRKNPLWPTALALSAFAARRGERPHPLAEVLEFGARAGLDGVELAPLAPYPRAADEDGVAELRRQIEAHGLRLFALRLAGDNALAPDAHGRGRFVDEAEERAALAQALGCPLLEVAPAGGLRGQTLEEALYHASNTLRQAAEAAARRKVGVAVTIDAASPFDPVQHLPRLLRNVGHPGVRPVCTPASLRALGEGAARAAYARVRAPSDPEALREAGWRGLVVIDPPRGDDPFEAAARMQAALHTAALRGSEG